MSLFGTEELASRKRSAHLLAPISLLLFTIGETLVETTRGIRAFYEKLQCGELSSSAFAVFLQPFGVFSPYVS